MAYEIGTLPLETLLAPAMRATEALVRLDERLAHSPVADGWAERMHFHDAAAALWNEGELVHLEDLVLRDAGMDQRAPTHALTRAHAVLRRRRRILSQPRGWALAREGLQALTGRAGAAGAGVGAGPGAPVAPPEGGRDGAATGASDPRPNPGPDLGPDPWAPPQADGLAEELAAIDAVLARSSQLLAGAAAPPKLPQADARLAVLYDRDWDEAARLGEWRQVVARTAELPAVLRAALALDAWSEIEVLQREGWIGALLAAALLRQDGVSANHLACLHLGARKIPRPRRSARTERVLAHIEALHAATAAGLKEHERLLMARARMERALRGRRASSKLPALMELALARPLLSTGMVQAALKVSRQGALDLIGAFTLREITGRRSFRAWGIG